MKLNLPVAFVLASALSANGSVHFVDDDGGPGVFVTIQDAVDAASEGDLILVQEGQYDSFEIVSKSLSVVGLGVVVIDGLGVARELGASELPVLRNLGTPKLDESDFAFGVSCGTSSGPGTGATNYWVENCRVDSLNVLRAETVVWTRNVFSPFTTPYLSGLEIKDGARARIYDSTFAPEKVIPFLPHGGSVNLSNAEAFFSGSTLAGGAGFDCDEGGVCSIPGDGGDGLQVRLGGFARFQDTERTGGAAGNDDVPGCTDCFLTTVDGEGVLILDGATEDLSGPALSIAAASPVASGTSTTLDVQATPSTTLAVAMFGESPFDLPLDEYGGILLVAPPYTLLTLPAVDASGAAQAIVPIGNLPLSTDYLQVFGQIVVVDPGLGIRLGSATSLEVVRADLLN